MSGIAQAQDSEAADAAIPAPTGRYGGGGSALGCAEPPAAILGLLAEGALIFERDQVLGQIRRAGEGAGEVAALEAAGTLGQVELAVGDRLRAVAGGHGRARGPGE